MITGNSKHHPMRKDTLIDLQLTFTKEKIADLTSTHLLLTKPRNSPKKLFNLNNQLQKELHLQILVNQKMWEDQDQEKVHHHLLLHQAQEVQDHELVNLNPNQKGKCAKVQIAVIATKELNPLISITSLIRKTIKVEHLMLISRRQDLIIKRRNTSKINKMIQNYNFLLKMLSFSHWHKNNLYLWSHQLP